VASVRWSLGSAVIAQRHSSHGAGLSKRHRLCALCVPCVRSNSHRAERRLRVMPADLPFQESRTSRFESSYTANGQGSMKARVPRPGHFWGGAMASTWSALGSLHRPTLDERLPNRTHRSYASDRATVLASSGGASWCRIAGIRTIAGRRAAEDATDRPSNVGRDVRRTAGFRAPGAMKSCEAFLRFTRSTTRQHHSPSQSRPRRSPLPSGWSLRALRAPRDTRRATVKSSDSPRSLEYAQHPESARTTGP
jgi:hypothetical protein